MAQLLSGGEYYFAVVRYGFVLSGGQMNLHGVLVPAGLHSNQGSHSTLWPTPLGMVIDDAVQPRLKVRKDLHLMIEILVALARSVWGALLGG